MELVCKQLTGPKIEAFLKIFPFLNESYEEELFRVENAVTRINANPELGVWCYITNKLNNKKKIKALDAGLVPLDLQNACHCFSGRCESKVVDNDTGQKYQLLDWQKKMTYSIKREATASNI